MGKTSAPLNSRAFIAVFILLQAIKIQDIILSKDSRIFSSNSSDSSFLVWTVVDALFIAFVYISRADIWKIPGVFALLSMVAFALLNIGLIASFRENVDSSITRLGSDSPIPDLSQIIHANDEHILENHAETIPIDESEEDYVLASFTVNLVNPSNLELNPSRSPLCINDSTIKIPVKLSGLSPWSIKVVQDFANGTVIEYDQIIQDEDYILVHSPGIYKAISVFDGKNIPGKVNGNSVVIVACPFAELQSFDAAKLCDLDKSKFYFSALTQGAAPLTLKYSIQTPSKVVSFQQIQDKSIVSNSFESVSQTLIASFDPIDFGEYVVALVEVLDNVGNRIEMTGSKSISSFYYPLPNAILSKNTFKMRHKNGLYESLRVPVELSGSGPWDLQIVKIDSHGKSFTYKERKIDRNSVLIVEDPGIYEIRTLSDSNCELLNPESLLFKVEKVDPPTLKINIGQQNLLSCLDSYSSVVNLTISGHHPFWLEYQTKHMETGNANITKITIPEHMHQLYFEPNVAGVFEYKFLAVGDQIYDNGVSLSDLSFTHTIYPRSKIGVASLKSEKICIGDEIDLDLRLEGTRPWNLSMSIEKNGQLSNLKVSDIKSDLIDLNLGIYEESGIYAARILGISDGHGCNRDLNEELQFEVLSQRPSVSFLESGDLEMRKDGDKLKVLLELNGYEPFDLVYRHIESKTNYEIELLNQKAEITLYSPGNYELVSLTDRYCQGQILGQKILSVKEIPKPNVEIFTSNNLNKSLVCQNSLAELKLKFQGVGNFQLEVTRQSLSEPPLTENFQTRKTEDSIQLDTKLIGEHVLQIAKISDENYQNIELNQPKSWHWTVVQEPEIQADFKIHNQCLESSKEERIPIQLFGKAPFNLDFVVKNAQGQVIDESLSFKGLDSTSYLKMPHFEQTGTYFLHLKSISDANGCSSRPKLDLEILVTSNALVNSLIAPKDSCVGDRLTWSLLGAAPFTVETIFSGPEGDKIKKAKIHDPILSVYAKSPGIFKISEVCNKYSCCSKPENLESRIHSLPRVTLAEGESVAKDVVAGDEALIQVEFSGVAPFSLSFDRISLNGQEESITLNDIPGNKHTLKTSQEGEFRLTMVRDRFCKFPKPKSNMKSVNILAE